MVMDGDDWQFHCILPLDECPSNRLVYLRDGSADNFTCCHTEIDVADQTFYLTQSQYTDTGPTSPSADPITPGACGIRTLDLPLSRPTRR